MADDWATEPNTPKMYEFQDEFNEEELFVDDTNVLNLDEHPDMGSEVPDSALYGKSHYDDRGHAMTDDEDGDKAELSVNGVLDEDTIAQGLSNLGRTADGSQQVFLHLTCPGFSLKDITILDEYVHLQKVEIPYNEITDLSPLSRMPYLLELDASHNQISRLLDFKPPKNLKIVDLSFNLIDEMVDLSAHHYLSTLILDNNNITEITGLQNCTRLVNLSIAHNNVEKIKGLDCLPIKYLNLSFNHLKKIENLESLRHLQNVNFSGNKIRSLRGLHGHEFLDSIDLEDNEVIDLSEVQFVCKLSLLRELNLQRNPVREVPEYRLSVLFYLQQLTELDRRKVDIEEKVAATNTFNPPLEVIAARDHILHIVYSFLQPSKVLDSTLPSIETPYPMLVLVGPEGAAKKELGLKLVEEFSDYFGFGVTHTTRKRRTEEIQGRDMHFVSIEEFEETVKLGKFLYSYTYQGELYGLTLDAVETVAAEGLACVVHMELEGVLTLKNTYFEPRYVLILPMDPEVHERRLREKDVYSEPQIQWTLRRVETYANYNRDHPGFFDMIITSDDILEAYKRLRRLVMDYLGISAGSPTQSDLLEPSNTELMWEKEYTADTAFTAGSANLARTWSKPSIPDSLTQVPSGPKAKPLLSQSPMPVAGRGIVEEESFKRRQSAAKNTVSGHVPTIYEQIIQRPAKTVPQPVSAQLGLGLESRQTEQRSYSAPAKNMDALPPCSPDSSDTGSSTGSSLSNISEARDTDRDHRASPLESHREDLTLPSDAFDRIELLSGSGSKMLSGSIPKAPRPHSIGEGPPLLPESPGPGSRGGSALSNGRPGSGRPGSERHRVLPPIGLSPQPTNPLPDF